MKKGYKKSGEQFVVFIYAMNHSPLTIHLTSTGTGYKLDTGCILIIPLVGLACGEVLS